jgi:segregation and condensation protein B
MSESTDAVTEIDLRRAEPGHEPAPEAVDLRAAEPTGTHGVPAAASDPRAASGGGGDGVPAAASDPRAASGGGGDGDGVAGDEQAATLDLDSLPMGARGAVEAVLMVVDDPIEESVLASALGLTLQRTRDLLTDLVAEYDGAGRGFELRQVAGGWRFYSRAEYAPVVERFMLEGQTAKLTQAALETLAIVAYRQPVSRSRVGAVRGVSVDAVMRTLSSRGLVEEAGNDPESGAVLYRTTPYFLQRIGLRSLEELPALAPYLPEVDALDELGTGAAS